ncbi:MAG: HNH endonuclease signature motif containing protein, partial [Mycobacterium sp.]
MFEELVAWTAGTCGASAVGAWARVESAACARRLAAMVTMLDAAHAADGSADREQWCIDNWAAVCAHIGATARLTSGTASSFLLV